MSALFGRCRGAAAVLLSAAVIFGPGGPAAAAPIDDAVIAFARRDYATALPAFRALADKGNAFAEYNVGFMYLKGLGVKADPVEAAKWYARSAEHGDADGQVALAELYFKGLGVKADAVEAYKWVSLAIPHLVGYERQDQRAGAEAVRAQIERKLTSAEIAEAEARARAWHPTK